MSHFSLFLTASMFSVILVANGYQSPFNFTVTDYEDFESKLLILESRYCRKLCGFEENFPSDLPPNSICDLCQCDDKCPLYGDCCPDVSFNDVHDVESKCINGGVKKHMLTPSSYRMMTSCPVDWSDTDVRHMCTRPCTDGDITCYIPVTDSKIGITFRNRYCGKCNGAQALVPWTSVAVCYTNSNLLTQARSSIELFNRIIAADDCTVIFDPSELPADARRSCRPYDYEVISSCNATGYWLYYDADVERACALYTRAILGRFKNMFCCLCNGYTWRDLMMGEFSDDPADVMRLPLTALLQFGNVDVADDQPEDSGIDSRCNGSQIYDKSMSICRTIGCVKGKYVYNNECRSYVPQTNAIGYRLCFNVRTMFESKGENVSIKLQELLTSITSVELPEFDHELVVSEFLAESVGVSTCDQSLLAHVHVQVSIVSSTVQEQTQVQRYILGITPRVTSSLMQNVGATVEFTGQCGRPKASNDTLRSSLRVVASMETPHSLLGVIGSARYVDINTFYMCPHVMLKMAWFEVVTETNKSDPSCTTHFNTSSDVTEGDVLLRWRATNTTLPPDKYGTSDVGDIIVCVEDFLDIIASESSALPEGAPLPVPTPLGVLSVVCTGVSLASLLVTITLYSWLRDLRTTGGVCNMGLVANMFTAQVVYEFGMEQNEHPLLCSILGVLIHFFWLAVVLWINACVVQFFFKLCFPLKSRVLAASTRDTFILSGVYSYGISITFVSANILAHALIFGDVGYGGSICYFNTESGQNFAFLLPVGLATGSNLVMFTMTVVNLRKTKGPSCGKDHRIGLLACIKLSAISGLAWIFGFLYQATSFLVLAYVFTILVGGQGFLLFLALMVNKRVFHLLKSKLRGGRQERATSGPTSGASETSDTRM